MWSLGERPEEELIFLPILYDNIRILFIISVFIKLFCLTNKDIAQQTAILQYFISLPNSCIINFKNTIILFNTQTSLLKIVLLSTIKQKTY